MGRPKALLPVDAGGETFLRRLIRTLLSGGADEVIVVVGADAEAIRANMGELPSVQILDNPDYERGQLTSLAAALRRLEPSAASGVLVTLVDVPLVSADTVRLLIAAHHENPAPVVRPVSRGRHGHPVIFHRRIFSELLNADPAIGAKSVVRAHASEVRDVPVDDEGAFIDIDTREDYERWVGPLG